MVISRFSLILMSRDFNLFYPSLILFEQYNCIDWITGTCFIACGLDIFLQYTVIDPRYSFSDTLSNVLPV